MSILATLDEVVTMPSELRTVLLIRPYVVASDAIRSDAKSLPRDMLLVEISGRGILHTPISRFRSPSCGAVGAIVRGFKIRQQRSISDDNRSRKDLSDLSDLATEIIYEHVIRNERRANCAFAIVYRLTDPHHVNPLDREKIRRMGVYQSRTLRDGIAMTSSVRHSSRESSL